MPVVNSTKHVNTSEVKSQKSPSIDCDLASYRIKWSSEVEQYFVTKQQAAHQIVRRTSPVEDEDDLEDEDLTFGGSKIERLRDLLKKTRL